MNMDITTRLREVPTMGHDAGCVEEAAIEIEKLRHQTEQWKNNWLESTSREIELNKEIEQTQLSAEQIRQIVREEVARLSAPYGMPNV